MHSVCSMKEKQKKLCLFGENRDLYFATLDSVKSHFDDTCIDSKSFKNGVVYDENFI